MASAIFYSMILLILILMSGFLIGCYHEIHNPEKFFVAYGHFVAVWAKCFALIPCFTTFLFLMDAFRRMSCMKGQSIILSKGMLVFHTLCFLSQCVGDSFLVYSFQINDGELTIHNVVRNELICSITIVVSQIPLLYLIHIIMEHSKTFQTRQAQICDS